MNDTAKTLLRIAGLATAIALAGCGSSSNGTATASAAPDAAASNVAAAAPAAMPHACDLLTAEVAKQFIGPSATRTMKAQPNAHMTHCHYRSSAGSIDVMLGDEWDYINEGQEHVPGEKPVAGLGDEAHINTMSLRVRKGTRGMEISATGAAGDYYGAAADAETAHGQALEMKVAKALLPRL